MIKFALAHSLVAFCSGSATMLAARLVDWETFNFLSSWNTGRMMRIGLLGGLIGLLGYWGHAGKAWLGQNKKEK